MQLPYTPVPPSVTPLFLEHSISALVFGTLQNRRLTPLDRAALRDSHTLLENELFLLYHAAA